MNLAQVLFITALVVAPVMDWPCGGKRREIGYVMMIVALVVCGVADGLNMGSLFGATGELPGRYMQAVFAGNASSGILIYMHPEDINKGATSPHPKGLRIRTQIYFVISTFIILVCIICCNLLHKLPIIQHYHQKRATASTPAVEATQHPPIFQVLKRIRWPAFGMLMTYIVTLTLSIVLGYLTENVGSKSLRDWYPILLLTIYNVGDFLGECLTGIYVPKSTGRAMWGSMARLLYHPILTACKHGDRNG